jgi:hypothetical protein
MISGDGNKLRKSSSTPCGAIAQNAMASCGKPHTAMPCYSERSRPLVANHHEATDFVGRGDRQTRVAGTGTDRHGFTDNFWEQPFCPTALPYGGDRPTRILRPRRSADRRDSSCSDDTSGLIRAISALLFLAS